jgi:3-hydroxyisobutyrate dehydrogenase-like beta-hydroxyacid dehydrogenase
MPLPDIGFIGLGIMGMPMARHLAEAGYPVKVFNRDRQKAEGARAFGAQICGTPREAAAGAEIVITMVTNPGAVQTVIEGGDGLLTLRSDSPVWIQMSTIDIASTLAFAEKARKNGWRYVDCPVTGSKKQVESCQLILLAGAADRELEEIRPLLLKMGKTIVHAGPVGAGSALKLSMNLVVAQMTTGLVESVRLAEANGINPEKIFEVLKNSPALDCGYFRIKEETLLKKDFSPAFSLSNMLKDVRFMTQEAGKRGARLPVTGAVQKLMEQAFKEGYGEEDLAAIYKTLKQREPD